MQQNVLQTSHISKMVEKSLKNVKSIFFHKKNLKYATLIPVLDQ